MAPPEEASWSVPAELDRVGPVVIAAADFLRGHGVEERPVYRVQVLLEEIILNVVRHGFGDRGDGAVEVEVSLDDDAVTMLIVDEAPPFDPLQDAPAPAPELPLAEMTEGGLGLRLVRQMADELAYERRDDRNRVRLRVDLAAARG